MCLYFEILVINWDTYIGFFNFAIQSERFLCINFTSEFLFMGSDFFCLFSLSTSSHNYDRDPFTKKSVSIKNSFHKISVTIKQSNQERSVSIKKQWRLSDSYFSLWMVVLHFQVSDRFHAFHDRDIILMIVVQSVWPVWDIFDT